MVNCTCQQCGKSFTPKHGSKGRYCSHECASAAKESTVSHLCARCGRQFSVWTSESNRGRGKYCSIACREGGKKKPCCLNCGKETSRIERKYCSFECMSLYKTGVHHHAWKGGQSSKRGKNWTRQRRLAFNRDGGTCQYCGYKTAKGMRKNAVHHIKPFREFNGDYLAANDLSNLITLCHTCHPKAERGLIPVPRRLL
jgi:DNA-directed RNA polymerase subunit RPC12/RpoP